MAPAAPAPEPAGGNAQDGAVQKHIAVLTSAGLVSKTRRGREQRVAGRPETVRTAQALLDELEQQWRGRIDRMGSVLADLTQEEQT